MSVIARNSNLAFINSAWGTPANPLTTGRGVHARAITLPVGKVEHYKDSELAGKPLHNIVTVGNHEPAALSFEAPFAVNGLPLKELIRAVLGTYAYTVDTPEAGGNQHVFSLDTVMEPLLFFTGGWNESAQNIQANNFTPESVEFKLDGHFWVAVNGRGSKSVVSAYVDATTYTAAVEYFTMNNTANYFRFAPKAQATLNAADNQNLSNISMLFQRNLENLTPTGGTDEISGIIDAKEFSADVTLDYATKSGIALASRAGHQAATEYMLEIYLKGSLISGTAYYFAKFQFPCLVIDESATKWESGKATTLKLKLKGTTVAPTPMAGITVPTITIVSIDTTITY